MRRAKAPLLAGGLALVLAAVVVRTVFSHNVVPVIVGDAAAYVRHGMNIHHYGVHGKWEVPTNERAVLFPALLALVCGVFKAGYSYETFYRLNIVLDALSVILLAVVARRSVPRQWRWGLLWVAISPLWIAHVNNPISEPLSVLLFILFLERWTRGGRTRRDEILGGVFLGLLTLTRSMFVLFPVALVSAEALALRMGRGSKRDLRSAAGGWLRFLAGAYLAPALWGLRNLLSLGSYSITQNSWGNVLSAWTAVRIPQFSWNNPLHQAFYSNHPWADVLLGLSTPERRREVELLMRSEIADFIATHPFDYLKMMGAKVGRLWLTGWATPFPYVTTPESVGLVLVWFAAFPLLLLGGIGLIASGAGSPAMPGPAREALHRCRVVQLALIPYITAVTFPFILDARYSLIPLVLMGLWIGPGAAVLLESPGAAFSGRRRPRPRRSVRTTRDV